MYALRSLRKGQLTQSFLSRSFPVPLSSKIFYSMISVQEKQHSTTSHDFQSIIKTMRSQDSFAEKDKREQMYTNVLSDLMGSKDWESIIKLHESIGLTDLDKRTRNLAFKATMIAYVSTQRHRELSILFKQRNIMDLHLSPLILQAIVRVGSVDFSLWKDIIAAIDVWIESRFQLSSKEFKLISNALGSSQGSANDKSNRILALLRAFSYLRRWKTVSATDYVWLMIGIRNNNDEYRAKKIFNEVMEKKIFQLSDFGLLIHQLGCGPGWNLLSKVLEFMKQNDLKLPPQACRGVLKRVFYERRTDDAYRFIMLLDAFSIPLDDNCCRFMTLFFHQKDPERVENVISYMLKTIDPTGLKCIQAMFAPYFGKNIPVQEILQKFERFCEDKIMNEEGIKSVLQSFMLKKEYQAVKQIMGILKKHQISILPSYMAMHMEVLACLMSDQELLDILENAGNEISTSLLRTALKTIKEPSQHQRFESIMKIVEDGGFEKDAFLREGLVFAYTGLDELDSATSELMAMFELGMHPSDLVLSTLLSSIQKREDSAVRAKQIMDRMNATDLKHARDSITILTSIFFQSREHEKELDKVLLNIPLKELNPSDYSKLLFALNRRGDSFEKITAIFNEMIAYVRKPSKSVFHTYTKVLRKHNKDAMVVLDIMKERGVMPSIVTFVNVVTSIKDPNGFTKAKQLLEELMKEGVEPNEFTISALLEQIIQSSARKREDYFYVLELMRNFQIETNSIIAYAILRAAAALSFPPEDCFAFFDEIKEKGIFLTENHYGALITGLAKHQGTWNQVQSIQDAMTAAGIKRTQSSLFCELFYLANGLMTYDEALGILRGFDYKDEPLDAFYSILLHAKNCIFPQGSIEVLKTALRMHDTNFFIKQFIAIGLARLQHFDDAIELFSELREVGAVSNFVYECLVESLAEIQDWEKVNSFLNLMKKDGITVTRRTKTICYASLRDVPSDISPLIEMHERLMENKQPNSGMFNFSRLEFLCKIDKWEEAYKEYDEKAKYTDVGSRATVMLFKCFRKNRQYEAIDKLYENWVKDAILPMPHVFNTYVACLNDQERYEKMLGVYEHMYENNIELDEVAHNFLFVYMEEGGQNWKRALELFEKVKKTI